MSEVWPFDTKKKHQTINIDRIREFKCLLLMPFDKRFDGVADLIKKVIEISFKDFPSGYVIERLDWVTSAGTIQSEIWQKIIESDLIFCDITGFNPNVMFELGVAAGWKDKYKVVLLKDKYNKMQAPFDILPSRYIEYEMVSDKIKDFANEILKLVGTALISFPDEQIDIPPIKFPLEIDFNDKTDDLRIYTPPMAHRLIKDGYFEFGALYDYASSWASIGREIILNSQVEIVAKFGMRRDQQQSGFIGIALRSSHFYANYEHLIYLNTEGKIIVTQPNETPPKFYEDKTLRNTTNIDFTKDYTFNIKFDNKELLIKIDDF
ncbi:MAG: hypothetical protein V1709_11540 [Planctomycetota bacterium]